MFKRRLGPWKFVVVGILGVSAQIVTMILAAAKEGGSPAGFGVVATVVIALWLDDVDGDRSKRKQNKQYIILTMASIFLTCALIPAESISIELLIQLTVEFAFMVAMITETKFMP